MNKRTTNRNALAAIIMAVVLVAAACGDDSDGGEDSSSEPSEGAEVITASLDQGDGSVSGVVTRTVPISEDGDGEGLLHLTLGADCRNDIGSGEEPLLTVTTDAPVSLAADDAEVPFTFTGLPDGTYFASGWIDDIDNAEQEEDLPATGDIVMFGDLSPRCDQFELLDGEAEDLNLQFDYEMPFTLPGMEGDEGILTGDGEPSVDPDSIVDDGNTYTVTMEVSRSVEPEMGGDGAGPWYSGLAVSCFDDETGAPAIPDFPVLLDELDLAETGEPVEIVIEDVPNGVYAFNGFIDDATDEGDPRPGIGDLVSFGGFGPACSEVIVDGADVTAAFDLNLVMPFDL